MALVESSEYVKEPPANLGINQQPLLNTNTKGRKLGTE
jgi:hypothetical protein